jgi:hypothetical protein
MKKASFLIAGKTGENRTAHDSSRFRYSRHGLDIDTDEGAVLSAHKFAEDSDVAVLHQTDADG